MQPPGFRIDQFGQGVHIRRLQFADTPVVEDLGRQLMLRRQLRERVFVRRISRLRFPDGVEPELLE